MMQLPGGVRGPYNYKLSPGSHLGSARFDYECSLFVNCVPGRESFLFQQILVKHIFNDLTQTKLRYTFSFFLFKTVIYNPRKNVAQNIVIMNGEKRIQICQLASFQLKSKNGP